MNSLDPVLRLYSIEMTARDPKASRAVLHLLPKGTEVFVADLPHQEPEILLDTCARLRDGGLEPVPHLVARNIRSEADLELLLEELSERSKIDRAFILGGDRAEPAGPYREALQLMESGLLQKHGIRRVALACFPEGHPHIGDSALQEALEAKLAAAERAGMPVLLVSQFAFDAQPVLEFIVRLRKHGISTPLRVGVAGPADAETLRRFGHELGVGDSMRALDEDAVYRPPAGSEASPYALLSELAAAQTADPALAIEGVHFFAFGSTARAIRWAQHLRS